MVRHGYTIGADVLRPASVAVAKTQDYSSDFAPDPDRSYCAPLTCAPSRRTACAWSLIYGSAVGLRHAARPVTPSPRRSHHRPLSLLARPVGHAQRGCRCRGSRCRRTGGSSSPPTGGRSSGWATPPGSCSTALTREDAERYLQNRAARVHGDPGGRARGVRRPDAAERVRPHAARATTTRRSRTRSTSRTSTGSSTRANALGLYVGFLPTWGDKWNKKWGVGPEIFTPENAAAVRRVARPPLQGRRARLDPRRRSAGRDRRHTRDHPRDGARAARGRRRRPPDHASTRRAATARPRGSTTTTGSTSTCGRTATAPSSPAGTTRRAPTTTARRPSRSSTASRSTKTTRCRSTRRSSATRSPPTSGGRCTGICSPARSATPTAITPSGRCGRRRAQPINNPLMPWTEAIDQPGAAQMQHGRALLESRPFLTRVPDRRRHRRRSRADERARRGPLPVRGHARRRAARTRWSTPRSAGRSRVRMDAITGPEVTAWWFNPRTGTATPIGTFPNTRRARVHAARPGRDARLGAGARRRVEELPAAGPPPVARNRNLPAEPHRRCVEADRFLIRCGFGWTISRLLVHPSILDSSPATRGGLPAVLQPKGGSCQASPSQPRTNCRSPA